jgi:glycerol-3-phosphate dehydrogenase
VAVGAIVNAAGPWVAEVLGRRLSEHSAAGVRLIKGTHIVVPRVYDGDHAYILQAQDGRVVFALPYGELNLIGTTDTPVAVPSEARADAAEIEYLCAAANSYFRRQTAPGDVVWSYAGIRSLYDDGAADAKDVTRDYRLELEQAEGAKLLSVFGGKITTARALAAEALETLGIGGFKFTRTAALPGGDLTPEFNRWLEEIGAWMPQPMLLRMAQAYGTRMRRLIEDAAALADLGRHFGADLFEAEVRYLVEKEFARTAEDILWRRTKLGLRLSEAEQRELARFLGGTAPARRG